MAFQQNIEQFGDGAMTIGVVNGDVYVEGKRVKLSIPEIKIASERISYLKFHTPTIEPRLFRKETKEILDWILQEIGDEDQINSDEIKDNSENTGNPNKSESPKIANKRVGFIIGEPGVGKTILTYDIYQNLLNNKDCIVFGIKTDEIKFDTIRDIEDEARLGHSLVDVIKFASLNVKRVVVILDQIDALSLSLSANRTPLESISRFIKQIEGIERVRVIASCRDFDINNDVSIKLLAKDARKWKLGRFSEEEVKASLKNNGFSIELPNNKFTLLGNPQNLSLYLQVAHKDGFVFEDSNSLYDALWDINIDNSHTRGQNPSKLRDCLERVSSRMHKDQKISLPLIRYKAEYNAEIQYLSSCGFLKCESGNIQFSHQTLYDYVYARLYTEQNKNIIEELRGHHQGLFLRSHIQSMLLYTRSHDENNYITTLKQILSNDKDIKIRTHIKLLAISILAYQENPTQKEKNLLHKIVMGRPSMYSAFVKGISYPNWIEEILNAVEEKGGWLTESEDIRKSIIDCVNNMMLTHPERAIEFLRKILNICDENERCNICHKFEEGSYNLNPETSKELYLLLRREFPKTGFPYLLHNLVEYDAKYCAQEFKEYIRNIIIENIGPYNELRNFNIGYGWEELFEKIEKSNQDVSLKLTYDLFELICESSAYDVNIYQIKDSSAYFNLTPCEGNTIHNDLPEFVLSHIIKRLDDKINKGNEKAIKEASEYLDLLLDSEYAAMVCAGLRVLSEHIDIFKDKILDTLLNKAVMCDAPTWVEYYSCELVKLTFDSLNDDEKNILVQTIMKVEDKTDKSMLLKDEIGTRLEHGIPLRYDGWRRGIILNSLPAEELKRISLYAWQELQRLKRKFKHLENNRPFTTSSHVGWTSIGNEKAGKMSVEDWKKSMIKYNTDATHDFTTPTLHGQCFLFESQVASEPDKFEELLIDILSDDRISMEYAISGLKGLIESDNADKAAEYLDKIVACRGEDVNTRNRNYSTFSILIAIGDQIKKGYLPERMFAFLEEAALKSDDSDDMDGFTSDLVTHSINRTRGNAVYKLVECVNMPTYGDRIFSVLEKIAPTANVSTRAAALLNMAVLNNIDKDRNVELFKKLTSDYNPLLMSMPLHNYNPLLYFKNYAFDSLKEYFERASECKESRGETIKLMWLTWMNKGNPDAKELLDKIYSEDAEARSTLISFMEQMKINAPATEEYILKAFENEHLTEQEVQAIDSFLDNKNFSVEMRMKIARQFVKNSDKKKSCRGLVKFLKEICENLPQSTIEILNVFMSKQPELGSYENRQVLEILLSSYNAIRRYDEEEFSNELEKAMDILDGLLQKTGSLGSRALDAMNEKLVS